MRWVRQARKPPAFPTVAALGAGVRVRNRPACTAMKQNARDAQDLGARALRAPSLSSSSGKPPGSFEFLERFGGRCPPCILCSHPLSGPLPHFTEPLIQLLWGTARGQGLCLCRGCSASGLISIPFNLLSWVHPWSLRVETKSGHFFLFLYFYFGIKNLWKSLKNSTSST